MFTLEQYTEFVFNHWKDGIEIFILTTLIYSGYRYFRATRGARILTGLLVFLVILTLLSQALDLAVIGFLIKSFSVILAVALVVIFQPELRRALAELGSHRFFSFSKEKQELAEEIIDVATQLSNKRFGALIAIEREESLKQHIETGIEIDGNFSAELVHSIFHPKTSLHDGGMIIRQGRIYGAGCVFPISHREMSDRSIGLRHRAGMGVTEETDAIAIIISEETGQLSLCVDGKIEKNLKPAIFKEKLHEYFIGNLEMDQKSSGTQLEAQTSGSHSSSGDLVSHQGNRG